MKKLIIALFVLSLVALDTISVVKAEDWLYTVRRGDTIWGLSHKYLKEPLRFKEIQEYNNISLDKRIPPGSVVKFPLEYLKFGPAEVSVTALKGSASVTRREKILPLTLESKLVLGDKLVTETGANVALLFADKSELMIGENSELVFDVQTKWGETGMVDSQMRLLKGSAEGRVQKLIGPGAKFKLETPTAVATVRGTEFRVRVDGDNPGIVFNEVTEGTVAVSLNNNAKAVKQGYGIKTQKNQPISEPKELLPMPILTTDLSAVKGSPLRIGWNAIDGAKNYKLELYADEQLTQQMLVATTDQLEANINDLEPGRYYARMRGIDNEGLEGNNKLVAITLLGVAPAPALTPASAILAGESALLHWQSVDGATEYMWQLSERADFATILSEGTTTQTSIKVSELAPKTYYWRVASINEQGLGRYSDRGDLKVTLPAVPVIAEHEESVVQGDEYLLSWNSVPMATRYHWQIAEDAAFDSVLTEGSQEATDFSISDMEVGTYYFRVSAVGPHNQARYSEPVTLVVEEPSDGKTAFSLSSLLIFILLL